MSDSALNESAFDEMSATNMNVDCGSWRNCSDISETPGANIIVPICTSIAGAVGNSIAIVVLHYSSRREQARTVFYVLVGALAWTDLLGILLTTWPVLVVYACKEWPGGSGLCNYHAFAMIAFSLITPCIVCTMAIERYIGIRHGYFYKTHVNRTRTRVVLLVEWVCVMILASLPLFGLGHYSVQYPGTWCFLDMHPQSSLDAAYSIILAIINLFMIIVIIVCNIIVTGTLLRMRYRRKHENSPANDKHSFRSRKQREIEIQMVILLIGITVVFTISWAPLVFQILINFFVDHNGDHRRDLLAVRLATINQIVDPWVYILFRKELFARCCKHIRRIFYERFPSMNGGPVTQSVKPPILRQATHYRATNTHNTHHTQASNRLLCPETIHREVKQLPPASCRIKEDSGTESGGGDGSLPSEAFVNPVIYGRGDVGPDLIFVDIKSRSWCCQYDPNPTGVDRKKFRTQSTQTPRQTNDETVFFPPHFDVHGTGVSNGPHSKTSELEKHLTKDIGVSTVQNQYE